MGERIGSWDGTGGEAAPPPAPCPALDGALEDITLLSTHLLASSAAAIVCVGHAGHRIHAVRGFEPATLDDFGDALAALASEGRALVVSDASKDDRFAASALVRGDTGFRFVASAPLWASGGAIFGALIVLDRVPRELEASALEALRALADEASRQFQSHSAVDGLQSSLRAVREEDAALRATNAALRALIDATPTAIVVLDPAGLVRMWSARAEAMVGTGGRALVDRLAEPDSPEAAVVAAILRSADESAPVERRLGTRRGGARDFRLSAAPLRDEWGKLTGFIGILEDITDRRSVERQTSAQHLVTTILSEATSAAAAWPKLLEALCETLEWSGGLAFEVDERTDALRPIAEWPAGFAAHAPDLVPHATAVLGRAEPTFARVGAREEAGASSPAGASPRACVSIPVPAGARPASVLCLARFDARVEDEGLLRRLALIATQLGHFVERKRIEEERDQFFNLTLDLLCVLGPDGRFRRLNGAWARSLGHASEVLVGRSILDFVHEEDVSATQEMLGRLAAGLDVSLFEHRFRCEDGRYRWLSWSCAGARPGQAALYAAARDVSEQKATLEAERQTEDQRRHAQRLEATGRLAGWTAHYFNNLLTAILGYSRLLLDRLPEGQAARDYARHILSAGERTAGLTQQLLAFSRRQVMRPALVDLNHVVDDMERMLRPLLGAEVQLVVTLAPLLDRVLADRAQLEQVLLNLVLNSRDALPKGGRISITTRSVAVDDEMARLLGALAPGQYVELSVEDTGIGMDPEVRAKLFEPFFTTKRLGQGTGLGMSMVYGIVQQSHGHIRVESSLGSGTRVEVLLPAAEGKAAEELAQPPLVVSSRRRILLVEDESAVRALTSEVLRQEGFDVTTAESAESALRFASAGGAVDVLVTDVVLPGMTGRQLAQMLRAQRPELRVLYMSGYATDDVARLGISTGQAFLSKPFTPDALAERVRSLLGEGASPAPA